MDNFRRSNVSINPINQSHSASPSRVPSVSEIRSRYESAQVDLMVYLKWIIVLIGAIIGVLFLKSLVGDAALEQCAEKTHSFRTRVKGYFGGEEVARRQSAARPAGAQAASRAAEGIWSYFLPGWAYSELNAIQSGLQAQRPAVRPRLPELPTLEAIRAHPARFNLSLAEVAQLSAERLREQYPLAGLLTSIDVLAGHEALGADATPAQIEQSRAAAAAGLSRAEELGRQLQQNTTAELVLKLHELRGSTEALAAKRSQLNELRIRLIGSAQSLTNCEEHEREQHQKMHADQRAEQALRARIAELEEGEAALRVSIEERERSLSENDRQSREQISGLVQRSNQLKSNLGRRAGFDQAVSDRRQRLSAIAAELALLRKKLADAAEQKRAFDGELRLSSAQPRQLRDELAVLEVKRKLLTMRLNSLVTRRQIKNLLNALVPDKDKKSTLETFMGEKLSEEKQMLEVAERYDREGNPVPDVPAALKLQIERDESSFHTILEKYGEWQRVVEEYDTSEDDIHTLQLQLREVEEQIRALQKRVGEFKSQENRFAERMQALEAAIGATQQKIAKLEAEATEINAWVAQTQRDLAAWAEDWETVQKEIHAKQTEFESYRLNVEQSFSELDKKREANRVALDTERAQLKEVAHRLRAMADSLGFIRTDCTAVKALYLKVAQLLPQLQAIIGHDVQAIAQLKKDLAQLIEPYTQLLG